MKQAAAGALFGLAIGDAMGFPTEFNDLAGITATFGPWRGMPLPVSAGVAYVTDDTQMTLALGEGLIEALAEGPLTRDRMIPPVRRRFVEWSVSPENNRAPGTTCLRACEALARGEDWRQASVIGSKGCGANMRVAPLGLIPGLDPEQRAGAAQLQSALTHGHPTALAASDLTAHAVRLLAEGTGPSVLLPALRAYAHDNRDTYHSGWLADLAAHAHDGDPRSFIRRGWDDCLAALDRLDSALAAPDPEADPCLATGAGWIAEEALATALHCFLLLPEDPPAVVRRAACSSGDSDSIAALAGAFAGAHHGASAWPEAWTDTIEYRPRLQTLATTWDTPA